MPTFDEIRHWSVDEVNAQILRLIPAGWKFELQTHPDHWRAIFTSETGNEVWADNHYELRILMLTAYGWLFQRRNPSRVHPAWRPGPPVRNLMPVRPGSSRVPDPESLDPSYIRSVYERHRKR